MRPLRPLSCLLAALTTTVPGLAEHPAPAGDEIPPDAPRAGLQP